jgi:hypothetical protein
MVLANDEPRCGMTLPSSLPLPHVRAYNLLQASQSAPSTPTTFAHQSRFGLTMATLTALSRGPHSPSYAHYAALECGLACLQPYKL